MLFCCTGKIRGSLLNSTNFIIAEIHRRALRHYLQPLISLKSAPRQDFLWAPLCAAAAAPCLHPAAAMAGVYFLLHIGAALGFGLDQEVRSNI